MKDKEKQIQKIEEELQSYSDIEQSYYDNEWHCVNVYSGLAKTLYDKDFRIVDKDSVVLSREELNEIINQTKETEKNYYKKVVIPQARNETAEKIYQQLQGHGTTYVKKWIKEQFGIEIKE